jgi:hypothetical protein
MAFQAHALQRASQLFSYKVGMELMGILSAYAFKDWPEIAKHAFLNVERGREAIAKHYLSRLPKA